MPTGTTRRAGACAPGCTRSPATRSSTCAVARRRARRSPRGDPLFETAAAGDSIEQAMLGWQVAAALERLTPEHRQMIRLAHFQGLSVREISERCELPIGTVKSRTWYALRSLRLALEEMGVVTVSCEQLRPAIGAYVLGGLEPDEAAAVRRHLESCPECAAEHDASRRCRACCRWPAAPRGDAEPLSPGVRGAAAGRLRARAQATPPRGAGSAGACRGPLAGGRRRRRGGGRGCVGVACRGDRRGGGAGAHATRSRSRTSAARGRLAPQRTSRAATGHRDPPVGARPAGGRRRSTRSCATPRSGRPPPARSAPTPRAAPTWC